MITGGTVLVLDGRTPPCEGLVLEDERVVATGAAGDMAALAGSGAERIELDGATAIPGLIDTHAHLLHFGALAAGLVDLGDARDHGEIVARIRARAAQVPAGQWILCTPVGEPHYFIRRSYRDLAERRLPDRHRLDEATTDHPVLIQAWAPVTPNVCAFNTAGLRAVGLTSFVPDRVCDVFLEKDERGDLTGIVSGSVNNYFNYDPYWGQILTKLPRLDPVAILHGAVAEMAKYSARGVTTVYEPHAMEVDHLAGYRILRAQQALTVRVLATLEAESWLTYPYEPLSLAAFTANLEQGRALTDTTDDWLRVNGVTLCPSGPCWSGACATRDPYLDPYGRPTRGLTFTTREKEEAFVRFCAEHGVRANLCMVGYRQHDEFLAIAEAVAAAHPTLRERRWVLQHAMLITPDHVRRYRDLGFQVTTCAGFAWGKGDVYGERLGPHVWRDLVPLKRLLAAGLDVAGGSDWGPKNPFEQMWLAETHEFAGSGRRNATADHVVTRAEALDMWTRLAARVLGWEGIGTLAPGSYADVAIVDRDPLLCPLDELSRTSVLRTIVGGRTVHDTGDLATRSRHEPRNR